jgi:hypothetical protein
MIRSPESNKQAHPKGTLSNEFPFFGSFLVCFQAPLPLGHTFTTDSLGHRFRAHLTAAAHWHQSKIMARPNEDNQPSQFYPRELDCAAKFRYSSMG